MIGAFTIGGLCSEAKEILRFVGYILTVVKLAIPLLIIPATEAD